MSRKWLWIAVGASPRLARSRSMGRAPSGADTIPHPLPWLVGTRRGCKMAQAGILSRIRARWPGRNPNPGTVFCAPELLRRGVGVSPVNGGPGGPAGAMRRPRDIPGGVLVPFSPGKKELARRAKPYKVRRAESSRPTGVTAHGDGRVRRPAPTTFQANHSRTETQEGQAPPLRDGGEAFRGGEPADGCRRVPLNCRGGPRPTRD